MSSARDDRRAFDAYARTLTRRACIWLSLAVLGSMLLFWPTDLWLFEDRPETLIAFAWLRAGSVVVALVALLLLWRTPLGTRVPSAIFAVSITAATGWVGYNLAGLGGLETGFFFVSYATIPLSVVVVVGLVRRVLFTTVIAAVWSAVFFVPHPGYLSSGNTGSIATFQIFVVAFSVAVGHAIFLLVRANFAQRCELTDERTKADRLLLTIFPRPIAERLKRSQRAIADGFPEVTVLFADLVGFTVLSQKMEPHELVRMLNSIFSAFDDFANKYGMEKIKTIGDAYMAAGGVPVEREDHAEAAANMALDMIGYVAHLPPIKGERIAVRIGIHSGPVVAGVIGTKKFTYDLWGDTVNTASRMESHGEPGRVQLSEAAAKNLTNDFVLKQRDPIEVKGKGTMHTWWLVDRQEESWAQAETVVSANALTVSEGDL